MKGDKLGRQGGSRSQEQPRREIMKGAEWDTRRQKPKATQKWNHEGSRLRRQGGSPEQSRKEIVKGDKAAAAAKSRPE